MIEAGEVVEEHRDASKDQLGVAGVAGWPAVSSSPVTVLSHQALLLWEPAQEADRGFEEVSFLFIGQLW